MLQIINRKKEREVEFVGGPLLKLQARRDDTSIFIKPVKQGFFNSYYARVSK